MEIGSFICPGANEVSPMGKRKPKPPIHYGFACELKVPAYDRTTGPSSEGGLRWTWALDGPATTECGYQCWTASQLLCHLVATHRTPLARARLFRDV